MSKPELPENPLAATRRRLGWTQQQMANELDIGLRTYNEQELSAEPRRAYVLAARCLEAERPIKDADPAEPLLDPMEELRAQADAAYSYAAVALDLAEKIAQKVGVPFDMMEAGGKLLARAKDTKGFHVMLEGLIDSPLHRARKRRADHLAGSAMQLDALVGF